MKNLVLNAARNWTMGTDTISESNEYTHLGVICNKYMDIQTNISECCSKLRKTFFSLIDCGIAKDGIHPLSTKKLYLSVVLPRALYGTELLNDMTVSDIRSLERAHIQCLKYMMFLPKDTRSDIVLGSIGIWPLENYIDKRKLLLFGQLCILNTNYRTKQMFVRRLYAYIDNPGNSKGFIPDIVRILHKYGLYSYFEHYLQSATFPSKYAWKTKINKEITGLVERSWQARLLNDNESNLTGFARLHFSFKPNSMLYFSTLYKKYQIQSINAMSLIGRSYSRSYITICTRCNLSVENSAFHSILFCTAHENERFRLWTFLARTFTNESYIWFYNLSTDDQLKELLSGFASLDLTDENRVYVVKSVLNFLNVIS